MQIEKEAKAVQALRLICDAIIETVKKAGESGVPGGVIYTALMTQGCTMQQYEEIMGGLVAVGKLTKRGNLYFAL
jgi:hypothetical protein